MDKISFIHAADLHLDTPFQGLAHIPDHILEQIQKSTFHALDRLVEVAIRKEVDFILLVGDLFDHEKQSLKAQVQLRNAFTKLKEHEITVYISYGNHDFIRGNPHPITYPDNVVIFPDETVRHAIYKKDNKPAATIYGFSYENRAIVDNKATEFMVEETSTPFHIAMLHGSLLTNTDHDMYAPFQIKDLIRKPFDYWALGHIHKRQLLKKEPPIIYPGNIQGRNRKETGEKGCYHVQLTKNGATLSFIPLQAIQFEKMQIEVEGMSTIHKLGEKIMTEIDKQFTGFLPYLIDLTMIGNQVELIEWKTDNRLTEMMELINEQNSERTDWRYIFNWKIEGNQAIRLSTEGEQFIDQLEHVTRNIHLEEYIEPLYLHREARKYLSSLSKEQQQELKKEAEELLYFQLKHRQF